MLKTLLAAISCLLLSLTAAAQTVEIDGLWYRLSGTRATVVAPPQGVYTGAVTLNPTVTYDGTEYAVTSVDRNAFTGSEITEFTYGEGFERQLSSTMYLSDIPTLKRVNIKSFFTNTAPAINFEQGSGCGEVFVQHSESANRIILRNFEFYGPDGEKLKPFLSSGYGPKVYPDENGVIELDANYRTENGETVGVTPISAYIVMFVGFEYGDQSFYIRFQLDHYQSGEYVDAGGMRYSFDNGCLAAYKVIDAESLAEDFVLPETEQYKGGEYPVVAMTNSLFAGNSCIKTFTASENLKTVRTDCFWTCSALESIDFGACTELSIITGIGNNKVLSEIIFPQDGISSETSSYVRITGCTNLKKLELPDEASGISVVMNGLYDVEIVECTENEIVLRVSPSPEGGLIQWGQTYLPMRMETVSASNQVECARNEDGSYTVPVAGLYNDYGNSKTYNGGIRIYLENPGGGTYRTVDYTIPESTLGVDDIIAVDTDAPVEYFDMQGRRVADPSAGIYIRRQGTKTDKIRISKR